MPVRAPDHQREKVRVREYLEGVMINTVSLRCGSEVGGEGISLGQKVQRELLMTRHSFFLQRAIMIKIKAPNNFFRKKERRKKTDFLHFTSGGKGWEWLCFVSFRLRLLPAGGGALSMDARCRATGMYVEKKFSLSARPMHAAVILSMCYFHCL